MLAAVVAAMCVGCVAPNAANRSIATVAAQPKKPTFLPTPQPVGVNKDHCYLNHPAQPRGLPSFEGLVLHGGIVNGNQFYACASGAALQVQSADEELIGQLITYVCDPAKPVTKTAGWTEGTAGAFCAYRDNGIPQYFRGLRIQVVR